MAVALEIMIRKIEELSASIEKPSKDDQGSSMDPAKFSNVLTSSAANTLAVFKQEKRSVTFIEYKGQTRVFLEHGGRKIIIPLEDVEGVPEGFFSDLQKMRAFLSESHVSIVEYLDNKGFKIKVNLKLSGGGHIGRVMDNGEGEIAAFWQVIHNHPTMPEINNKISIPYEIIGSHEATRQLRRRGIFVTNDTVNAEYTSLDAINEAIQAWNNTGLVNLYDASGGMYGPCLRTGDTSWIQLSTRLDTEAGLCHSGGIGRHPSQGARSIVCDLNGTFKEEAVQSIMHEIGHVIGLRHEHARSDRDQHVDTNMQQEPPGVPVGTYDFGSVMHYAFGRYPNGDLQPKPHILNEAEYSSVGSTPVISQGDRESVAALRELYSGRRRR